MVELRRNLQINGITYQLAVNQYGSGVPSSSTPGKPGVLYLDTNTGLLYKCLKAESGVFTWDKAFVETTPVFPDPKTLDLTQKVGVDENGKLWTRNITGCLHTADLEGSGAVTLNIPKNTVNLSAVNYSLTFGDKIITNDCYLYEIYGVSLGAETVYTGKLLCRLAGGAGEDILLVSYGDGITASHSAGEIYEACNNGKAVFLVGAGGGPIALTPAGGNAGMVEFSCCMPDSSGMSMYVRVFSVDAERAISYSLRKFHTIPDPAEAQEGQTLRIVNGTACWMS